MVFWLVCDAYPALLLAYCDAGVAKMIWNLEVRSTIYRFGSVRQPLSWGIIQNLLRLKRKYSCLN